MPVHKKLIRLPIVRHVNVGPAVTGQIKANHGEASPGLHDACFLAHVTERAVPLVTVELVRDALVSGRPAILSPLFPARLAHTRRIVDEVMDDIEVEIAVAVVVKERGPRAPIGFINARASRRVDKGSIAVVEVEGILQEVTDINIRIAVAVHVADGDPISVALVVKPSGAGDFNKVPPRLLPEQLIGSGRIGLVGRRMANQVNIQVSILVRVEQGNPRGGDLGDLIAAVGPWARWLGDSHLGCDLGEKRAPTIAGFLGIAGGKTSSHGSQNQ